jgi:hypothetical protein
VNVPFVFLARHDIRARVRWDEWHVDDIVCGAQKRANSMPPVTVSVAHEIAGRRHGYPYAIVSFPAGAHDPGDIDWLNQQLSDLERVVLFCTSDEAQRFPHGLLNHPNLQLWVQLPRPEHTYPPGTLFLTEGSGRAWREARPYVEKRFEWMFAGQINHKRRRQAMDTMNKSLVRPFYRLETPGFLEGLERQAYLGYLAAAKAVPCPSGIASQSSFRAIEALELGAVPILDARRDDGGGEGYWEMTIPRVQAPQIADWRDLNNQLARLRDEWPGPAIAAHSSWHWQRFRYARDLAAQTRWLQGAEASRAPTVSVLIPTSPILSHPSVAIIEATIRSVQERMPGVEIIVMCDGVRAEQQGFTDRYQEYLRNLCLLCEQLHNVTPIVFGEFLHQAEMTRRTLARVDCDYLFFVEHDAPLVNDLDLAELLELMRANNLNLLRLHHESHVLPDHMRLMIGLRPRHGYWPTMQWSQRPHLARTNFYRRVLDRYFREDARSMIEDVMSGTLANARRNNPDRIWNEWRLAIFHPPGNIQRSDHLDGRKDEPKYDNRYRYAGEGYGKAPPGAPNPDVGIL